MEVRTIRIYTQVAQEEATFRHPVLVEIMAEIAFRHVTETLTPEECTA